MTIYIVTRNCCLGPCCSRQHPPNKPIRIEQLRTTNKKQAERCKKNFNTYPHTYNAEIKELKK